MATAKPALDEARAAYRQGDWPAAREAFSRAAQDGLMSAPEDLVAAAQASWWCGRAGESVRLVARAHRQLLDAGRLEEAASAASDVAMYHLLLGQLPLGSGWMNRASRLLRDVPESPTHGYVAFYRDVEYNLPQASPEGVLAAARGIVALSRRQADRALALVALVAEGYALAGTGRVPQGMTLLDDAMVGLDAETMSPEWLGNAFCMAMEVAERVGDVARMRLWLDDAEQWLDSLPAAVLFTGACRVYRARLWQLSGEWERVEPALDRTCRELRELCQETVGAAWLVRGELRLLTGDRPGAETAFGEAHRRGADPQLGLALLQLDRGDVAAAGAAVRTALLHGAEGHLHQRARLLTAAIRIACAADDLAEAQRRSEELRELGSTWPQSLVVPLAGTAAGAVALARGAPAEALPPLRAACHRWHELGTPYEAACSRQLLARCYRALGDRASAELEEDAAAKVLARLRARPAWPELGGRATAPTPAGLTRREAEVLRLLAAGLHNADIAATLTISRRTVERHLSNLYPKLGVGSRSAATRYAVEHSLV
ncbi:LuxR family transcriptional regulator [Blastococcus sp. VKM Ac-2987]|uniref:LuxR family transcriptional regulator n=1 Tax=Blastococcus sp. VKM Ac-2987 TaxID=3004141 RepID=UPI0022AB724B|nr:LuxR family transcriptional regulator [Blastococcus sp. VKM Ac-2987]MCZ2860151.1 LuxR C-terminal-related transcriptional regulator [Blastococcus sp. VKM Ac-2987]